MTATIAERRTERSRPHWVVTSGSVTLTEHAESGTILLDAADAGSFSLGISVGLLPFA